jgi:uncharacterized protein
VVFGPGRAKVSISAGRSSEAVESPLRPLPDLPLLALDGGAEDGGRALVLADLHLGLGATVDRPAGPPEAAPERLARGLLEAARSAAVDSIIIAGDVKHPIVGTPPPLRPVVFQFFSDLLASDLAVEVVLGNHDVGLVRHLPREVVVHPSSGIVRDGVGIFHGHRWPSNAVLRASRLVAGHLHPGFRLAPTSDDPSGKRRCWVRVELPAPARRTRRRRRHAELRAKEIVVLPAFNPLAGTEALNRSRPARGRSFLYQRFLSRGVARAYLLDGTDLGELPTLEALRGRRR